jgi:glycosidase
MGNGINSPVGVDAALDYPFFNTFIPVAKGAAPPNALVEMYHLRKRIEQYILSSHGEASRYFVTFLDNHDMKKRFLWVEPGNEHYYDDQLTMAVTCLYCLPGIPCVYYGTEQGLHGINAPDHTNDAVVREALWGIQPQFPQTSFFFAEMKKIAQLRTQEPTLRYGRFYFRPVSGNSFDFSVSPFSGGILAWSRILNDREVLIVANTNTTQLIAVDVILDSTLSRNGQQVGVLYSNKRNPVTPGAVKTLAPVQVKELDDTTSTGPLQATRVTLAPMEVQVLRVVM